MSRRRRTEQEVDDAWTKCSEPPGGKVDPYRGQLGWIMGPARPMKPADHPDFFRLPAPAGRSRESTIVLRRDGNFFHDGARVEHQRVAAGLGRWVQTHPDDGRFILSNGYDWCYFEVEDTAFFVLSFTVSDGGAMLALSDGSEESLCPDGLRLDEQGVLRARVKEGAHEARFSRTAQLAVEPWLAEDGSVALLMNGVRFPIADG